VRESSISKGGSRISVADIDFCAPSTWCWKRPAARAYGSADGLAAGSEEIDGAWSAAERNTIHYGRSALLDLAELDFDPGRALKGIRPRSRRISVRPD